jgi:hypothetical protein
MPRSLRLAPVLLLSFVMPVFGQSMAGMNMSGSADVAQLGRIRAALDRYRDPIVAVHDGYFSTVACIEFPTAGGAGEMAYRPGAMGVHFLNLAFVGPQLDTLHPQVLIYEPVHDTLRLVAAEWFMPTQVSATRPRIFGRDLDGPMEGHAPIMAPEMHHWDLHVWLWKDNPNGMFSPTNSAVHCPSDDPYTVRGDAPRMVGQ